MNALELQTPEDICNKVGAEILAPGAHDKLGISRSARSERPVHGLRVSPTPGMSGWYIWSGEMSQEDDFFDPSHVAHIRAVCPLAWPFLSLPPGWRFLTDGVYADVWHDPDLLR